jgi:hypothetical protein
MRTKVLIIAVALVAVAIPSGIAFAEKFRTRVTAHVTDDQEEIFGVVRSREIACEKGREVRLYGPEFDNQKPKRGAQEFRRLDEDTTNRFGEYRFSRNFIVLKGGYGGFQPGDYFVRAIRKDFPGDVCRRDDSPIVTIFSD